MLDRVVELVRDNRETLVARLMARILETIPRYTLIDESELHHNIDDLFGDVLFALEDGSAESLSERFAAVTRKRSRQGFELAEFLNAVLLASPIVREFIAEMPGADRSIAAGYALFERALHEVAAIAANIYTDTIQRKLVQSNQQLEEANARLVEQERNLAIAAEGASRGLESANEFNRRVIDSLLSGLMVVDSQSLRVTLFTDRAADITGIDPAKVLGRELGEALAELAGLEVTYLTEYVRQHGLLPLTKFELTLADGRRRAVYVRAHRMFDAAGEPRGTVVCIDDITERELLFSAFSRYAPRELVRRLLAGGKALKREGQLCAATVLVVHLDGFSHRTEGRNPFDLQNALDDYFRAVVEGSALHGGFVDKLFGDRALALFLEDAAASEATAKPGERSALAAVRATAAIRERLLEVNKQRSERDADAVAASFGVCTGDVVLGNLGNEERMEFTAIGDPVTIADRLAEHAAAGEVLLGASTAALVDARFELGEVQSVPVKGRVEPLLGRVVLGPEHSGG